MILDQSRLSLPIMAAVAMATSVSRFFIYTVRLKEKGIDIGFIEEVKVLGGLQVKDAMSQDFEVVANHLPVKDLIVGIYQHPGRAILREYCLTDDPLAEAAKQMVTNRLFTFWEFIDGFIFGILEGHTGQSCPRGHYLLMWERTYYEDLVYSIMVR